MAALSYDLILSVGLVLGVLVIVTYSRSAKIRRSAVAAKRLSDELRRLNELDLGQKEDVHLSKRPQPIPKRSEVMAEREGRQPVGWSEEEQVLFEQWLVEGKIRMSNQEFMDWLPSQTPDTWHAIVQNWNWDYGSAPLMQIVSQPECDFGTAFKIFFVEAQNWLNGLDFEQWRDKSYQDSWYTCEVIAKRWHEKSFHNANFWLEGDAGPYERWTSDFLRKERALIEQGKYLAFRVPDYVYAYQGNRKCVSDFTWMEGNLMHSFDSWKRQKGAYPQSG